MSRVSGWTGVSRAKILEYAIYAARQQYQKQPDSFRRELFEYLTTRRPIIEDDR